MFVVFFDLLLVCVGVGVVVCGLCSCLWLCVRCWCVVVCVVVLVCCM